MSLGVLYFQVEKELGEEKESLSESSRQSRLSVLEEWIKRDWENRNKNKNKKWLVTQIFEL